MLNSVSLLSNLLWLQTTFSYMHPYPTDKNTKLSCEPTVIFMYTLLVLVMFVSMNLLPKDF